MRPAVLRVSLLVDAQGRRKRILLATYVRVGQSFVMLGTPDAIAFVITDAI